MSGTSREYLRLQRPACQRKVSYDVEELVARWLSFVTQLDVIQDALLLDSHLWLAEHLGNIIKFIILHDAVDDHDRVVEVPAANEIVLIKHFKLVQKTKRPARSNFFFKLPDIRDGRVLTAQNR